MFFSKAILVVVVSIVALSVIATPHALSPGLHHRAIAARVASPHPGNLTMFRKRQNTQRCKHRPTSSLPKSAPSSSTPVQPHTTTQQASPNFTSSPSPSPSPSPTSAATPTASQPASGNNDSFYDGERSGDATFYDTGLGSCGITSNNHQNIVALSRQLYDIVPGYNGINPNTNPVCNKQIEVTYEGKRITATVVDRCYACKKGDIDLSPAAFNALANPALGRVHVKWKFL